MLAHRMKAAAAGAGAGRDVAVGTFIASATGGNSITVPTAGALYDVLPGDWAILAYTAYDSTGTVPTDIVPAGWEKRTTLSKSGAFDDGVGGNDGTRCNVVHKILDADDIGDTLTLMSALPCAIMLIFAGPIASVAFQDEDGELTGGNPASDTVTSGSGTEPLVVFAAGMRPGSFTTFPTQSPAFDIEISDTNFGPDLVVGATFYAASAVNQTVDISDGGVANWLASCYVELIAA